MSKTEKATHTQPDPFALSLEEYRALGPEREWALTQELFRRYGRWLEQQFRKSDAALLAVCDHEIVYTSSDRYDFHVDEVMERVQRERKKPCFVVTHPVHVEETSPWSDLGQGDFYPTVQLYLGTRDWSEAEVFQRGVQMNSDFDTGNPALAVFDEAVCFRLSGERRPIRQDLHLGRPYRYRPRLMKLGIRDGHIQRVIERVVEGVEGWDDPTRNPFKLANPRREGFVGRDLMLQALFRITLDPRRRESSWVLL